MRKFNYLNFLGDEAVTIRKIIAMKDATSEGIIYFEVSLEETDEIIRLSTSSENAHKITPGIKIQYAMSGAIGHCLWENGIGPFKVCF